jgi:dihydroxyacetone kinase
MLSAVVCGAVFASPSVDAILTVIRTVCGPHGCLLVVKNYTGDRLNFGLAAEQAKVEGFAVEMCIVGDDVAVNAGSDDDGSITGRRGLAGTLYVHKIAGAAAAAGASLSQVTREARAAAAAVGSMAVALTTCHVPGRNAADVAETVARIGAGEMELGLGIHNESGVEKRALANTDDVVEEMIQRIDAVTNFSGKSGDSPAASSSSSSRIALMVNNLGGAPVLELYVAARAAKQSLQKRGVVIAHTMVGTFMSSLQMVSSSGDNNA